MLENIYHSKAYWYSGLVFLIVIIIFQVFDLSLEQHCEHEMYECQCPDFFKKKDFKGLVKEKKRDKKNHLQIAVTLLDGDNIETIPVFDDSLYAKVQVGDYLEKESESLVVKIRRDTVEFVKLTCGCPPGKGLDK